MENPKAPASSRRQGWLGRLATFRRVAAFARGLAIAALLASCSTATASPPSYRASTTPLVVATAPATTLEPWAALLSMTPVPFATRLPPADPGPMDGLYAKLDPSWPQWWSCRRCADYRPAGGMWRLQFDRSVIRIYYEVTKWKSLASYEVRGDRLFLFNDPYCPFDTGEYEWSRSETDLSLHVIQDVCAFDLRAKALSEQTSQSCPLEGDLPQGAQAFLSRACGLGQAATPGPIAGKLPVAVQVFAGDARKLGSPPEAFADANASNGKPVPGASVRNSPDSLPYGRHRILWRDDDWVEVTTTEPFAAIGVQFLGSEVIGWARVLFDGVAVWQGETSQLGNEMGLYGGFVEISGLSSGVHTLRVERLPVDSRPVDVLFFTFRRTAAGD